MIKKNSRITKAAIKRELSQYKKIAPVYEKQDISKAEMYMSNAFFALAQTVKRVNINKEYIELLVWLYQFEFFERNFVYENYMACFLRTELYGSRRSKNALTWLIDNLYLEPFTHQKYEFRSYEQRDGFIRLEDVHSDSKYKLSISGLDVVRAYYSELTGESIAKKDYAKKRLIFKGQNPMDDIDYRDII